MQLHITWLQKRIQPTTVRKLPKETSEAQLFEESAICAINLNSQSNWWLAVHPTISGYTGIPESEFSHTMVNNTKTHPGSKITHCSLHSSPSHQKRKDDTGNARIGIGVRIGLDFHSSCPMLKKISNHHMPEESTNFGPEITPDSSKETLPDGHQNQKHIRFPRQRKDIYSQLQTTDHPIRPTIHAPWHHRVSISSNTWRMSGDQDAWQRLPKWNLPTLVQHLFFVVDAECE